MKTKFKEDNFGMFSKPPIVAATIIRRRAADIANLFSSSSRCRQSALPQLVTYGQVFATAIVAALAIGSPLYASSDSENGKRAWEAGYGEVIEILMETGTNVNIPDSIDKTAVKLATTRYGEPASETIRKHESVIQAPQRGMLNAEVQGERKKQEESMKKYPVGKEFQDCDVCPRMVIVSPGTFLMGSPATEKERQDDEGPQHQVTISNPFAVGKYEVTREQFEEFVEATGHDASSSGCWTYLEGDLWQLRQQHSWRKPGFSQSNDHPVVCVNWHDAQAYVSWLSRKTGEQYRLLSESEWEYVARAGTTGPFHFGSTISTNQANYRGNYTYGDGPKGIYRNKTVSVGSFAANRFGLHDVHGNVWEWVEDCWHETYHGAPLDGSAWVTGGDCDLRVLRGGSWVNRPMYLRSAFHGGEEAGIRSDEFGLRVARTLILESLPPYLGNQGGGAHWSNFF